MPLSLQAAYTPDSNGDALHIQPQGIRFDGYQSSTQVEKMTPEEAENLWSKVLAILLAICAVGVLGAYALHLFLRGFTHLT
jgi:hypothetical protein